MKHHLPALDSLKAFESAARHLSFSLAADELCISKGAISYQIRKLEQEIKSPLFKRSIRQVYLTDAGQTLFHSTQHLFKELNDTLVGIQDDNQQSNISIAATTYVAARWLSSRISLFSEEHPNIQIMLHHSVNSSEFTLADVDLAIRWGPCISKSDKNRFAEIPMPIFPAISPQLLKSINSKHSFLDINSVLTNQFKQIPLLCEDRPQDLWQEWIDTNSKSKTIQLSNPRRIISDANVRVQAAIDGQGLILADDLMKNEINNNLLIAPFEEQLIGYGYAFMSSPKRLFNNNAKILKDWMLTQF